MALIQNITGVILAGGMSSRFGSNKALVRWRGKFLIQHVRDTLAAVFSDCLLVTNTPEQYAFLDWPMIGDRYQNMGPLAGIHAALCHAGKPWIFVLGCDMPAVSPPLVSFLCGLAAEDFDAVVPWLKNGVEPLCSLYHKTALVKIEEQLKNETTQIIRLLEILSVRKVKEVEFHNITGGRPIFVNVNRREDLDRLP